MNSYGEVLALRVLEQWCLVGEEPMSGDQWNAMCVLAGVDPETTAIGATYLRAHMTLAERQERMRELGRLRALAAIEAYRYAA